MRATLIVAVCVALGLVATARADLEVGTYAPDLEAKDWLNAPEAVSLSSLRGMTVVLFFWVTWHPGGEDVMPFMNLLNSEIGRSRGVYIMAVTDSDRKRVEDMVKKNKVFFPVALECNSYEEYKLSSFPRIVVIDPNGKIAWIGWPQDLNTIVNVMFDLLAKCPPTRTHPDDAKIVREQLDTARTAMQEGRLVDAFRTAQKAYALALTGDELKTRCHDMLGLVEAIGRDRLALAERATDEKDFETAVTLLSDLKRDFRNMDVGQTARKRLDALKAKYDEVVRILDSEKDTRQAESLLAEAMETLRTKDRSMDEIGSAYEKLQSIVKDYAGTPAATKAQTVLQRMEQNVGIMNHVADYQAKGDCELWMSQARAYEQQRQYSTARDLYRRVIDRYPNTIWADRAAVELRRLPEGAESPSIRPPTGTRRR